MVNEINGYVLSRSWFDFVAQNRDKVKPAHTSLFFWCVELWNKLGQPPTFGLPTQEAHHHSCISSHTTFSVVINDLTEWGFIAVKVKSKNQYTANVISICLPKKWQSNLKANEKHITKQSTEQLNSTLDIIELKNIEEPNKPINNTKRHVWANSPFKTYEAFEKEFIALGDITLGEVVHKPQSFDIDFYFRALTTYGENHPQKKYVNWVKERRNWIVNNFLKNGEQPVLKKIIVKQFEEIFSPTVPVLPKPIAPIQQEIPKSMFEEDEN